MNGKGGAEPAYDYESDEFYDAIFELAFQGATDAEIPMLLSERLGRTITDERFANMKSGTYAVWTPEENERFSKRIKQVLTRARLKINYIVRGRYLKAALGGIKLKSKTTVSRRMRIDGILTDDTEIQTSTTESETAPNIQALTTWLNHHDKDWRKAQMGDFGDEDGDGDIEVKKGIDIDAWIRKEVAGDEED